MVGRLLALPGIPINKGVGHSRGDAVTDQDEVYAHALVFVEATAPVIPPCIQPVLGLEQAECVDVSAPCKITKCVPLSLADMCGAREVRNIPHVPVLWGDVEVTTYSHRLLAGGFRSEVRRKRLHPTKLGLVVLAIEASAVGHVNRRHFHTAANPTYEPPLGKFRRSFGELALHPFDTDPGHDRHAVPLAKAIVDALVPKIREHLGGESRVGEFRLL